ncbi:hypothetical protein LUZ63_012710 [Rhynchospora breviuscula]|uniref:Uncharacterized protein n=1 Tax=Rhynchospora breviuscula TaxID=2022672 RepID=A0A9Q0HRR4_9POAL|nr:hypothetical protein LUZ63_012710 [Rhynchospora breviuscula]
MAHQITEEVRAKAEVYLGDALCQEKMKLLLKEVGLPNGLLPLRDIIECGYVEETGFVWLKQKKKIEHTFSSIGRLVSYAAEITAYVEKSRIKKVTGVKAKELLLWVPLYEIYVDEPSTGKLHCKSTAGVSKTFPVSAFEVPEDPPKEATDDAKAEKKENGVDVAVKVAPLEPVQVDSVVTPAPTEQVAQVVVNK